MIAVMKVAEALAGADCEVRVLTSTHDHNGRRYHPAGSVTRNGVEVTFCRRYRPWRYCLIPSFLLRMGFLYGWADVVYLMSCFNFTSACVRLLDLLFKKPLVVSPRGCLSPAILRRTVWFKRIHGMLVERPLLRRARVVHCTTPMDEQWARSYVHAARTRVIPNGLSVVDPPAQPVCRERETDTFDVLFIGRFHPVKNIDALIEAFQSAGESGWRLWLVGASDDAYSAQVIRRYAANPQIHIEPFAEGDGKWSWYAKADLVALVSVSENFGNVVVEALACGVPVLVSTAVGLSGMVTELQSGVVTLPFAPSIADGLRRAHAQIRAFRANAVASKALVQNRFSWERAGHEFAELTGAVARTGAR